MIDSEFCQSQNRPLIDNEKKYDAELIAEGVQKEDIIHYGMAFSGKEALVEMERL